MSDKMAAINNRNFIHIDISEEYNEIALERLDRLPADLREINDI